MNMETRHGTEGIEMSQEASTFHQRIVKLVEMRRGDVRKSGATGNGDVKASLLKGEGIDNFAIVWLGLVPWLYLLVHEAQRGVRLQHGLCLRRVHHLRVLDTAAAEHCRVYHLSGSRSRRLGQHILVTGGVG
ncbi:hypothetical protein E2C01_003294 [Portunus trituberculatus]|uniref:Uncharacterized protein n=1 Tax=Portunus trituberculatus TaxID=210409 RepID=A0A5B7CNC2_PORTR|nr:hypothetical protein [Portunus trituberculatus]